MTLKQNRVNHLIIDGKGTIVMSDFNLFRDDKEKKTEHDFFSFLKHEDLTTIKNNIFSLSKNGIYQYQSNFLFNDLKVSLCQFTISQIDYFPLKQKMYLVGIEKADNQNLTKAYQNLPGLILDAIKDAVFITDFDGYFIEMNKAASLRTGIKKREMKGKCLFNIQYLNNPGAMQNYFVELKNKNQATAYIDYINIEGQVIHSEIYGNIINIDDKQMILHVSREISPRKTEFNQLLDAIIQAEEKDRSFLAKEIHEELGQILSLIKFYLETYFDTENSAFKNEIADKLDSSVNQALSIVPSIADKLSPHLLKNLGIEAALRSYIQKLNEQSAANITFNQKIDFKIDGNTEIILYRTIISLLEYCVYVAAASQIKMTMNKDDRNIKFVIIQNGLSMKYDDFSIKGGNRQLFNQVQKIQSINGNVYIEQEKNDLTEIQIVVPIN